MSGVSASVLEALARALQLDDAERLHLSDLARASQPTGAWSRRRETTQRVRPAVQHLLDAMTGAAALVSNERLDVLGGNSLGYAVHSEMFVGPARPVNAARFVFLDPRARDFYVDWEQMANDIAAMLHSAAGRDPYDRDLTGLIDDLSARSEAFCTAWAAHKVCLHATGVKRFRHPVTGELHLNKERMDLATDSGLTIITFTAEPGSRSEQALRLLGSWAASTERSPPDS